MTPLPTQISGAVFLAQRRTACLADQPRVGKTGAALLAADLVLAAALLIVTTSSGRAVWRRAVKDWCAFDRDDVQIVSWADLKEGPKMAALMRPWDVLILDESHYAKSFEAGRTRACYGKPAGSTLYDAAALAPRAKAIWALTGTPAPNSPLDLYPMMRALCPERLAARGDWPDVTGFDAFQNRYCVTRPKKVSRWHTIHIVMGSRNEEELRDRLDGFLLRRTQEDVGIRPPHYELFPLPVTAAFLANAERGAQADLILAAARDGSTKDLEMHLGPLRRVTGALKLAQSVTAANEAFECGQDKLVLMAWHTEVVEGLTARLAHHGAVKLDGSTPPRDREEAVRRFQTDPKCKVFVGQIQAAGEAIDLSAAAELWFVESSFVPKDMQQAALRITNHSQTRQAVVRVCVLEGSIDEALQAILLRKWTTIREVIPMLTITIQALLPDSANGVPVRQQVETALAALGFVREDRPGIVVSDAYAMTGGHNELSGQDDDAPQAGGEPVEPKKRGRKPAAEKVEDKPQISTQPESREEPATAADMSVPAPTPEESAAAIESMKAPEPKKLSVDDIRVTAGGYIQKYGMPAAMTDLTGCLQGFAKMSDLPNDDQAVLTKVKAAIEEMIANNPFDRAAVS